MKNGVCYFEDGSEEVFDSGKRFCVTARIILKESTLLAWRDFILSGPNEEEAEKINLNGRLEALLNELTSIYRGKYFRRKDAVSTLGIDDATWIKLYKKGVELGIMKFEKNSWEITQKAK